MDCLFCKIGSGEIDSYKVYENEDTLAFLDINPSTQGHTMVIPKKHIPNILDLPDDLAGPIYNAVKKVALLLSETLETKHFTIGNNNGRLSGQEVDHLHIHVIPRYEGDGGGSIQSVVNFPGDESLEDIAKDIQGNGKY
ncbi:MAG: HIT family protein [Candidatus Colwellbacteria bacterium CG10_big_fil_rev_8_21_14_0_10_41_28]|uniref:HIT family protein n=1 Tax=Candidatus Colwellbacteria bacterium CG10_big_fil_rev_8_21_14_0_10_41_28 TaxID=1974539 RepID=A0A2H0VJ56_9BACT|nr:MAG: HIT family protein [Candidatus Colwellbacteria bacterium CG10_big_fil_rev_8_21_14_0_10_41_28]